MLIRPDYKCIFIHIPKTAGNSISEALKLLPEKKIRFIDRLQLRFSEFPRDNQIGKHAKAYKIKKFVGERVWREYFTFTFIRNPWDAMVSSFHWWLEKAQKWETFSYDRKRVEEMDFSGFIKSDYGKYCINEVKTDMFDHISSEKEGKIIVDFVGRYENLQEDWSEVCRRTGIEAVTLPLENQSAGRREYRKYYTGETAGLVRTRFSRIIEHYHYEY